MKRYWLLLLLVTPSLWSQPADSITAAKQWLALIDTGSYQRSWQQADPFFQSQLSQANWQQALQGVRTPLGAVISRTQSSTTAYTSLPGIADGEYVVMIFTTVFENKQSSIETVTFSKSSGSWKAVGYYIK